MDFIDINRIGKEPKRFKLGQSEPNQYFEIFTIVNAVHVKFNELVNREVAILTQLKEFEKKKEGIEERAKLIETLEGEEKEKLEAEVKDSLETYTLELNEYYDSIKENEKFIEDKADSIIKLILNKNGYDFIKDIWDENTDIIGKIGFIKECIGTPKKKVNEG